jgi:nucleotide-binding universal stress UspA family protein
VLLARDDHHGPFTRIVAGVDFSPTSLRALQRAAAFAERDGAEIHVLHNFDAPWRQLPYRPAVPPLVEPALEKEYRDSVARRLDEFARPVLEAHPGVRFVIQCADHDGHRSGIVEYAESVSADLIALGTRGGTNLRDVLLGSTAEKVLVQSHCSVLAVKPEDFEAA